MAYSGIDPWTSVLPPAVIPRLLLTQRSPERHRPPQPLRCAPDDGTRAYEGSGENEQRTCTWQIPHRYHTVGASDVCWQSIGGAARWCLPLARFNAHSPCFSPSRCSHHVVARFSRNSAASRLLSPFPPSLSSSLSSRPQAAAFDIKLSHSRTSAKVSMANQAAEMEATVAKRIEAKVQAPCPRPHRPLTLLSPCYHPE